MLKKESILKGMSIMLILMLFVSLALAGCAKDGETGNDTPDEEPNVETPAEDDKDTDDDKDNEGGFVKPEGDPVELIWLMGDPGRFQPTRPWLRKTRRDIRRSIKCKGNNLIR